MSQQQDVQPSRGYDAWLASQGYTGDATRLSDQNNSLGRAHWGVGQRYFIHNLRETYQPEGQKFQPRTWFELGVGPGAELVINALEEFGAELEDQGLVMVEIDPIRLEGAKVRLQEHFQDRPELLAKVDFSVDAGDAADVLKRHPKKADVIHAQLLFQHLLPDERKNILHACGESLNDNGLLLVADIAFDDWTARPSRRGLAGISQWRNVQRERRFIRDFRREVYSQFGKRDFPNAQAIERMIRNESTGDRDRRSVFEILPQLRDETPVPDIRLPKDRDEIALLSTITTFGTRGRRSQPEAEWFNERLADPEREEMINYPKLARIAARRIPQQV